MNTGDVEKRSNPNPFLTWQPDGQDLVAGYGPFTYLLLGVMVQGGAEVGTELQCWDGQSLLDWADVESTGAGKDLAEKWNREYVSAAHRKAQWRREGEDYRCDVLEEPYRVTRRIDWVVEYRVRVRGALVHAEFGGSFSTADEAKRAVERGDYSRML